MMKKPPFFFECYKEAGNGNQEKKSSLSFAHLEYSKRVNKRRYKNALQETLIDITEIIPHYSTTRRKLES
jgi:hypothetical protein